MKRIWILAAVGWILAGILGGYAWRLHSDMWRVVNVGSGRAYIVDSRTKQIWLVNGTRRIEVTEAER